MYRVLLLCLCLPSTAMAVVLDSEIWINELHYDNVGADEQEFVEVAAPAAFTDLSNVTLTLYNGNGGTPYGSVVPLESFASNETVDGYTFYSHDVSLQNGSPDGLALAHGHDVLQFLSYEGEFAATAGPADTLLSTDIGVEETPSTPLGFSLQLAGRGDSYLDFSWQAPASHTQGALNGAQSVVPEPSSLLLCLSLATVSLLFWRRWRPSTSQVTK